MEIERIRDLTYSFLEGTARGALQFEVIEKGGSGRCFYRVSDGDSPQSWIAMVYSNDRPDNARFASITDFLINHRVAVPAILGRREEEGYLLVQDLGNIDLGEFEGEDWEMVLRPRYESALETVFALHEISEATSPPDLPQLEFCFDADLYQWEQDYFFNHYASHFESEGMLALRTHPALLNLRDWLSSLPRFLVHRDFQSTNVMFLEDQCYLIDYQGMRFGLPEYDVASLVFDPYVGLDSEQQSELITHYYRLKQRAGHDESFDSFVEKLDGCALQRLMQALGAYGFLGLTKGKREFLQHIAPARLRLASVAESAFPEMHEVLRSDTENELSSRV